MLFGVAASGPVIQKASQSQVDAGTDNTRYITPLTLATKPGLGGSSTNNLILTGSTVIRTNLIVDSTGSATISVTNILEVVHTNGLKLVTVSRNTGQISLNTNVVVNGAEIGGQALASTNIFQVDTPAIVKSLEVGTNGYAYFGTNVYIKGNGTSTSNNAALWLNGDAAGVSGTNYQLRMSGTTDPLKSLLIGLDTTANAAQLQATRIGVSSYSIGINPNGGAVGVGTVVPETWGKFAVRGSVSLNSKNVSSSFSDASTGTLDIRHATGVIDISSQDAALTLSTTTGGTAGIERMRISTAGAVSIGTTLTATNGLASYSIVTAVSIAATGWTNLWSTNNAVVYLDTGAADLAYYVKNNAGTSVYTNISAANTATVILQPSGAVVITAGTTPTGRATPF